MFFAWKRVAVDKESRERERERERVRERVWNEVGDLGFGVWSWTRAQAARRAQVGFEEPRKRGGKKKEIGCRGGGAVGRDLEERFILRGF